MELDFSFTLVRSAPVKSSKKSKPKKVNSDCGTIAADSDKKQISTLSLSCKKRDQNSMNVNQNQIVNKNWSAESNKVGSLNSVGANISVLSDIVNKTPDKAFGDNKRDVLVLDKSIEQTARYSFKVSGENKENLSPVQKDLLVMSSNEPLKNKYKGGDNIHETVTEKSHSNNSSINKNSSSSSTEVTDFVELKKVSLRRHQFESYKKNIRNGKLYFYKKKKNVIETSDSSTNLNVDCSISVVRDDKIHSKVLENGYKSILKDTSLSRSNSVSDCCNVTNNVSLSNKIKLTTQISGVINGLKLNESPNSNASHTSPTSLSNCISMTKGIKRSITVARSGFKRSEKSLNNSESIYFHSRTKSKGNVIGNDDDPIEVNDCSFKSIVNETIDNINDSKNSVNKSSLFNGSRLSGVASLVSDNVNDSILSASFAKQPFSNNLYSKKSNIKKERDSCETETNLDDVSQDIFNNSVKRKISSETSDNFKLCNVKKNLSVDKSCKKSDTLLSNQEIKDDLNSVCKSNSKTLKNVSLNSSVDFDNSIIDSSTPRSVLKCQSQSSYRKSLKSCLKLNVDSKIVENELEKQSVPLSFPLPSYESPILSRSKVKDITKWLAETEKCKNKNPFESSDSNNEEEVLSISPPLINKKLKSAHLLQNVNSESKIKSLDARTPEPANLTCGMRKPLTEPNKMVNTVSKSKPRSVQKKRSTKKERKKLEFSSDSDETDNPAARILDQLYGQSWRALNALPLTEPKNRRQKPKPISHQPMTERKNIHKSSMFSSSSSDDHFEEFIENIKLKRLALSEKQNRLKKLNGSFIDESFPDDDNSITSYQKIITSDIKKEIDALSDSKWSRSSHNSGKSSEEHHPRRLSFGSIKGNENSDNTRSNVSSKKNKKVKKKSPDKIIRRHVPINTSHHHNSDSSGKKKKRKNVNKKKILRPLNTGNANDNPVIVIDDDDDEVCGKKLSGTDLREKKNRVHPNPDTVKEISTQPTTPVLMKESSEIIDLTNVADPLRTPIGTSVPTTPRHTLSFLGSLSVVTANLRCHPDALLYKKNYKTKKEELSRKLFSLYNKEVFESKLPNDMLLQWNGRMRSTSGFCYNRRLIKNSGEVQRTSRIVLSSKILDTPDRLRDTLIHEMCHAATWIINGISDGHGPRWKFWATKAMQRFPEIPRIKRCHDYDIKTKYTYRCTSCGYSFGRHSKSLDTERKRCGYCYGKFELLVSVKEKLPGNGRGGATPLSSVYSASNTRTPRPVTGFALFVKQNYGEVKKSSALPHKDVMKLLSQKFSEFKFSQNKEPQSEK